MRRDTLDWHALRVGDAVTPLRIDVTATVVVAGAIATRDFMPVHHDRNYANSQGSPEIFMNILSDTGFCSRFLTDWAGPQAMVRKLSIRLGVPAYAGGWLEYTGSVAELAQADGEGIVVVAFRAAAELGDHLTGTAEIGLPLQRAGR